MSFREGLDDQGTYYQINKVEGTTPILFIHGVGLDHSIWEPQIKFFKDQTTITYDLIGHGLSTCILDEVSFEDFSNQIEGLLQILKIQKVIIIGFSLGGLIAAHFSSTRKNNVLKTVWNLNNNKHLNSPDIVFAEDHELIKLSLIHI